jgi:hypothetical protein
VPRWSAIEKELRVTRGPLLAGVDEVGRGPLAGPVVACAVIMPSDARAIRGVDDSKQLTAAVREKLAERIRERALAYALGAASVREIERFNIYHASVLAMRRAITRLAVKPDHVLIDGNKIRTLGIEHTNVVGGDSRRSRATGSCGHWRYGIPSIDGRRTPATGLLNTTVAWQSMALRRIIASHSWPSPSSRSISSRIR